MADSKISALPAATTPLVGTEVLPIVQSGVTDQVTVANLTAGRAVSALSVSTATVGATTSATLSIQANATTYVTVLGAGTNNGFVGIGTTSPQSKLSVQDSWLSSMAGGGGIQDVPVITNYIASTLKRGSINFGVASGGSTYYSFYVGATTTPPEVMRIDSTGNLQMQTGSAMPYAPAPAAISAAATLTNANIQGQIISATGTTYTITMPLGTTLETLAKWAAVNVAYDFFVINTATGIITMAVNTGVTSLGSLTIAIGGSAHFRIRRTAADTFVLYRLV